MRFCPNCGVSVPESARFCVTCGKPIAEVQPTPPQPQYAPPAYAQPGYAPYPYVQPYQGYGRVAGERSVGLAVVLSFLWTGLGQLYNHETAKGVLFFVLILVLAVVAVLFWWLCFPVFPYLIFWMYGMYDAYVRAQEYNHMLRATGRPPW